MQSALVEVCFINNENDMDFFLKNYDENGSYISIREILENVGLTVSQDTKQKDIIAEINKNYKRSDKDTKILLLGNEIKVKTYIYKNKHYLKIERAYIPIRDVFEILGFKVKWNRNESMIVIYK